MFSLFLHFGYYEYAAMSICVQVSVWAYFQFSGVHARAELLGQMEALMFHFLRTNQSDFQRGCCTTYFPTSSAWGWFLCVLASVSYPSSEPRHHSRLWWHAIVVLIRVSLMIDEVECLLMCLLAS